MADLPSQDGLTLRQAMDIVQGPDGNQVDPYVIAYLERVYGQIWARIQDQPDTYLLSRDEFACFNFFQQRHQGSEVARKAVERYWDHHHG